MDNETVFVLNTQDLLDAGFEGSFNDLADDIEAADGIVTGEYASDGDTPVMVVSSLDKETLDDLLNDYSIEDPDKFTSNNDSNNGDVEDFDDIFNDENEIEDDEDIDLNDIEIENDDSDSEDEDLEDDDEDLEGDDEEIDIVEDDDDNEDSEDDDLEDDEEIDIVEDDDDLEDDDLEDDDEEIDIVEDDDDLEDDDIDESLYDKFNKGTKNLSESATINILNHVKDKFIGKRITNSLKESMEKQNRFKHAISENLIVSTTPYANIKVNGHKIYEYGIQSLTEMLSETKKTYKKFYKKYKSLNESEGDKKSKYIDILKKEKKLYNILESEIAIRKKALNEDDSQNAQATISDGSKEESGQTATLTSIVFKVKNADDFIKTMVSNGIPEEAFEKVDDTDTDTNSDANQNQQDANAQQASATVPAPGASAAPTTSAPARGEANPFESLMHPIHNNKLNEDDNANPFGDPNAQPQDGDTDPNDTTDSPDDEGESVKLVDTSYAAKVRDILAKVYGYSTDQFDENIGGTIEDSDENSGSEDETDEKLNDDTNTSDTSDTNTIEDDQPEDSISPEDIFGDI